ncbi:Extracellular basic protease [Arthrobacter sp. Bi83]|uniref:S8 family serine peptidase n=1 Tax=Arthrobacter sp. Bi83 TaxID=2822353 RepID=UPI001D9F6A61|nr:S8 family serine peptidase [Arthrobacter sp. Bi83]CAH0223045.1 Extracellular basic protease [Arthrobacter sp. Bi83]
MSHARRSYFSSLLASAGVAVLAAGALIGPPASADDAPAPLPAVPPAASIARPSSGAAAATNQFIVKFKDGAATVPAERAKTYGRAAVKLGSTVKDLRATSGGARVLRTAKKLGAGDSAKLLASLRADPAVAYAEPDVLMHPKVADPNDPYFPFQWNLSQQTGGIKVTRAWDVTQGAGQVVAVVDTGITRHDDVNANVLQGYDMITDPDEARDGNGRDSDPTDEGDWTDPGFCAADAAATESSWHGTFVAGIIGAVTGNADGIAGVAPKAKILPVRAMGPCGGFTSDITDAVIWASGAPVADAPLNPTPARVINLSLGGTEACSQTWQDAINTATGRGAAVVVAAGNESVSAATSEPANCQNVITVAASGPSGSFAPYSNFGPNVDVTAPGGDMTPAPGGNPDDSVSGGILSIRNDGATTAQTDSSYYFAEGTSAAAPHVAGVAALLMAQMGPTATPAAVEARLKRTARPVTGGCPSGCGAGLVDAAGAVLHINAVVAAGDLNGDRKSDVLARDNSGALWLYPGNGSGGWLARVKSGTGWNGMTAIVAPGDFNGDGRADVLARDSSGALWLFPGNGRGGFLARVKVGSGWNAFSSIIGPGDINGDAKSDVLARDTAGVLWLYPGNGRGGWLARVKVGSGWNSMTAVVGPGDMNGDRRADVLARDTAGALWLYTGNGRGGFSGRLKAGIGWNAMTAITARGDFNGDARNDVLAVDSAGALWLYKGNGVGGFLGRSTAGSGWN